MIILKKAKTGQLSKSDIFNELNSKGGMSVVSCVNTNKNIHAASIDITPTIVCMSVKSGMLQTVYVKKSQSVNSYYVLVKPHDTVLIISNEFVCVPNYMSGYVTSRVSNVVSGFGHICTTIDPNWKGALLIGLSNPTNRTIQIDVGTSNRFYNNEKMQLIFDKKPLATLTFHYLCHAVNNNQETYSSMRTDLLKSICYKERKGIKKIMNIIFHPNQKRFTDYFFEYLKFHENSMKTSAGWKCFLNEFSVFNNEIRSKNNSLYCKCASDFIIKENILNRAKHFIENHKAAFIVILVLLIIFLCKSHIETPEMYFTLLELIKLI